MAELGNNIFIYAGEGVSTPALIGNTRSNDIQGECDMIEKTSPSTAAWKEFIPGRKSWVVNTTFIVVQTSQLSNLSSILKIGNLFTLQWRKRGVDSAIVSGTAYLKSVKYDAPIGNFVSGQFTFQGTGALT